MPKLGGLGGLAAGIVLLQLAALSTARGDETLSGPSPDHRQSELQRAAAAEATGPTAISNIAGRFRIDGIVRKKTAGITSCSCTVTLTHFNNAGGDYYTYGSTTVAGTSCKMNLPFRFAKGDTGRPVVVTMSASCSGDISRYFSQDLPDIPLAAGNSKIVKFDIDM